MIIVVSIAIQISVIIRQCKSKFDRLTQIPGCLAHVTRPMQDQVSLTAPAPVNYPRTGVWFAGLMNVLISWSWLWCNSNRKMIWENQVNYRIWLENSILFQFQAKANLLKFKSSQMTAWENQVKHKIDLKIQTNTFSSQTRAWLDIADLKHGIELTWNWTGLTWTRIEISSQTFGLTWGDFFQSWFKSSQICAALITIMNSMYVRNNY